MVFICLVHGPSTAHNSFMKHVYVGSSAPVWLSFPELKQIGRQSREQRFGGKQIDRIRKALDQLCDLESQLLPIETARLTDHNRRRHQQKAPLQEAKVNARTKAIEQMRGKASFIDHTNEFAQPFNGRTLKMEMACYACQGIFGYRNTIETSEAETRIVVGEFNRTEGYDHRCAEAAASIQCKTVYSPKTRLEPYSQALLYMDITSATK